MEHLSASQITLLVAGAGLAGGLLGWFGRGIGFVLARWWTGAPKHERATYLNTVADLGTKLRASGMTMEEVQDLEGLIQNPSIKSSGAAAGVVEVERRPFQSTYAMKARAGAAYGVAEAKLNQALQDLQLLVRDDEWGCVERAQERWEAYRGALMDWALREYDGGTHATLAATLTAMAETERRAAEIQAQADERSRR